MLVAGTFSKVPELPAANNNNLPPQPPTVNLSPKLPKLPPVMERRRAANYDPRNFSFRLKDRESVVVEQGHHNEMNPA